MGPFGARSALKISIDGAAWMAWDTLSTPVPPQIAGVATPPEIPRSAHQETLSSRAHAGAGVLVQTERHT